MAIQMVAVSFLAPGLGTWNVAAKRAVMSGGRLPGLRWDGSNAGGNRDSIGHRMGGRLTFIFFIGLKLFVWSSRSIADRHQSAYAVR